MSKRGKCFFDRWLATLPSETRRQMQTVRFNHAQLTLLTTLDQSSRKQLRNQDLTAAVPFSQGLVSRYVARLVQLNLLTKLSLPDNRKAYIVALTRLVNKSLPYISKCIITQMLNSPLYFIPLIHKMFKPPFRYSQN